MPVVEVAIFNASEAYIQDPLVIRKGLELVSASKSSQSIHYGLQVEDKKTGYLLIVWDSYEAHERFKDSPESANLAVEFRKAFAPDPNLVVEHVIHEGDDFPTESLTAPVTEIVEFHLQSDKLEEAKDYMAKLDARLHQTKAYPYIWGEIKERANKRLGIIGWDTIEDHWEAVGVPDFKALLDAVRTTTTISLKHTKLTKFAP